MAFVFGSAKPFLKCILLLAIVAFLSVGCSSQTPLKVFRSHMDANLGKNISDPRVKWMRPEYQVEERTLANQNIEKIYRFQRQCIYAFEIENNTGKILSWRYVRGEQDCQIRS